MNKAKLFLVCNFNWHHLHDFLIGYLRAMGLLVGCQRPKVKSDKVTFREGNLFCKVNSVQEACAKCFAVHLQTTWKNIKMLDLLMINWKLRVWSSLFHFFHVICKISNFNMWTAKHLAQASCTELTLFKAFLNNVIEKMKNLIISNVKQSKSQLKDIWETVEAH